MNSLYICGWKIEEKKTDTEQMRIYNADEADKEIEQLRRNKNTWKAKAERLIDFNNIKDKEIERLKRR